MDTPHRLLSAVNPQSVAVIGASDRDGSRGSFIWRGVMNSRRVLEAYPVNPKYKYIGLTPCWAKITDLPTPPDLAVIATSSRRVEEILTDCAKAGIKNVLVTPGEGSLTEDRLWREKLAELARKNRMRLVGVDSMGLIRPKSGLNVSYWPKLPLTGSVGLVCQTTSTIAAVLDYADKYRFGFSSVVSVGTETDVSADEVIDCLAEDDETKVIAVDVLALRHPRAFFSAVRAAARKKPVLILHGASNEGIEALTAARLGSPSPSPEAFAAAVKKAGGTATSSLCDFCGALHLLSQDILPRGTRTAVLGNGIGAAATGAAALATARLLPARLSSATHNALIGLIGSPAAAADPTDAGPEADDQLLAESARLILADPAADALITILTPAAATNLANAASLLAKTAQETGKPIVAVRLGATDSVFEEAAGITGLISAPTPEAAARMIALTHATSAVAGAEPALSADGSATGAWNIDAARTVVEDAQRDVRFVLSENDLSGILHAYSIPLAAGATAATPQEAAAAAKRIGYPVALKVSAEGIAHKTDARGVILNVNNDAALASGFCALQESVLSLAPQAKFRGVWVQTMVNKPAGRELRLTLDTDPVIGPVIRLGVGGVAATLFKRELTLVPPVTEAEARTALESFEARSWFDAFRGMPQADVKSLITTILRLSAIAETQPAITKIALSPLLLDDEGVVVLDAEGTVNSARATVDDKTSHLTFAPSPKKLHHPERLSRGFLMIRCIRNDDAGRVRSFAHALDDEVCQDFFGVPAAELTARVLERIVTPDFDREIIITAVDDSTVDPAIHALVRITRVNARESILKAAYEARWQDDQLLRALGTAVQDVTQALQFPLPLTDK